MASVLYNVTYSPTVGSLGTLIEYKNANDSTWIIPDTPANPTTLSSYPLTLETENTYNIRVSSYGGSCTAKYKLITVIVAAGGPCCPEGYTLSSDSTYCYQENTTEPTILETDYCLAVSQLSTQYTINGTCFYDAGYTDKLVGAFTLVTTTPQWREASSVVGPMNREGVWVDSDCNGAKDPLTAGQVLNITFPITTTSPTTLYVGIAGDNAFKLQINGVTIVDCTLAFPAQGGPAGANFNFWHVFPVVIGAGTNYFSFSGVGDGSVNDSFAAVVYDNSLAELTAATDDSQLNILFKTSNLVGDPIEIAECPTGYFLDTSEGPGAYVCRQILLESTITC